MDNNYIVSARKYRPLGFEQVVGQSHITKTLDNAIQNNKLASAMLFCGPRGVGKTTCARIVARLVNNLDTSDTQKPTLNIFELDAASNNSVDDIRNLTDQIRYPPQSGQYKVYIIDEVHMLSNAAFNAFLKTLEEPPSYAIFILATTERHKVLPTILSRCQLFEFRRIQIVDIIARIRQVADYENIEAEEEALELIAKKADGALRDALSLFDMAVSFAPENKILYQDVIQNFHVLSHDYYFDIIESFIEKNVTQPLLLLDKIIRNGFDIHLFINGFAEHLRNLLISNDKQTAALLQASSSVQKKYQIQASKLTSNLLFSWLNIANECDLQYKHSKNQRLLVELALMKMAHANGTWNNEKTNVIQKKVDYDLPHHSKINEQHVPTKKQMPKEENNDRDNASHHDEDKKTEQQITPSQGDKKQQAESDAQKKTVTPYSPISHTITPKLPSLIPEVNKTLEKEKQTTSPKVASNKIVKEDLLRVWNAYMTQKKDQMGEHYLLKNNFNLEGNTITLNLSGNLEVSLLNKIKTSLLTYLREQLNNDSIQLNSIMRQKKGDEQKIIYTNEDKFNFLIQKNPTIQNLTDRLSLDYDF